MECSFHTKNLNINKTKFGLFYDCTINIVNACEWQLTGHNGDNIRQLYLFDNKMKPTGH